jgi:hypothetical protein
VRAERPEEREATWLLPPAPIRELAAHDAIYQLGVETESPEALAAAGLHGVAHAPYVPRDIDGPLTERLRLGAASDGVSLTVISGPSKAGKSRTMLEAATSVLECAWMIAPRDAAALARIARDSLPRELGAGPVCDLAG